MSKSYINVNLAVARSTLPSQMGFLTWTSEPASVGSTPLQRDLETDQMHSKKTSYSSKKTWLQLFVWTVSALKRAEFRIILAFILSTASDICDVLLSIWWPWAEDTLLLHTSLELLESWHQTFLQLCALLPQVPRSLPRQITVQLDFRKPVLENAAHYTAVVKAIRIYMVLKPTGPKPAQADWKDSWCCSTVTPQQQRGDHRGRTQDWGHRGAAEQLSKSLSSCSRTWNMPTYSVRPSTLIAWKRTK